VQISDAWLSVVVKGHDFAYPIDSSWETTQTEPADWPNTTDPGIVWEPLYAPYHLRPRMGSWNLSPNIFAGAQKDPIVLVHKMLDKDYPKQPVYIRKRFTRP
jgi:hypothetical protein